MGYGYSAAAFGKCIGFEMTTEGTVLLCSFISTSIAQVVPKRTQENRPLCVLLKKIKPIHLQNAAVE